MSDSSMGSNHHLKDSIILQWKASQVMDHFLCKQGLSIHLLRQRIPYWKLHKIKFQLDLKLFLFAVKGQQRFFCFYGISRVFSFWPEQRRYIDMPGHIFKTQNAQLCFPAATQHFPFHPLTCQSRGLQLHWDCSPDTDPMATPRGKANCIFYNSSLLSLPFLPSLLPCFLAVFLPSFLPAFAKK